MSVKRNVTHYQEHKNAKTSGIPLQSSKIKDTALIPMSFKYQSLLSIPTNFHQNR